MQKVYHVFISSTYADLKEERRTVSGAVSKAGYVAEGMELFPASSQQQFDFIKRVIDRCDYYVVILGGRYGSLADDNIGYTEKEYEYALEKGMSILAFIHADTGQIASSKTEQNPDNIDRLYKFRERLTSSNLVDFWTSPDELATKVAVALAQETNLNPSVGWVRGDQAIDPKLIQELEDARRERDELLKLTNSNDNFSFPDWMPKIDEEFELEYSINFTEIKLRQLGDTYNPKKDTTTGTLQSNWRKIFCSIGDDLYNGINVHYLANSIMHTLLRKISDSYIKQNLSSYENINPTYELNIPNDKARDHLLGYNLIETKTRSSNGREYTSLEISEFGKKYLAFLNVKGSM